MRRTTITALGLVAATSVLTACGSATSEPGGAGATGTPTASSTPAQPSTTAPVVTESPTSAPPSAAPPVKVPEFPEGTREQYVPSKGSRDLVLLDIRVAEHDGFDRVVLDFRGSGTPGWNVKYENVPRADGSGKRVDVRGDSFLTVFVDGTTGDAYPEKSPMDLFDGPPHFAPADGGIVHDVNYLGVWEGGASVFLGLDGDRTPFRVFPLRDPSRLVIDLKDD